VIDGGQNILNINYNKMCKTFIAGVTFSRGGFALSRSLPLFADLLFSFNFYLDSLRRCLANEQSLGQGLKVKVCDKKIKKTSNFMVQKKT